MQVFSNPVTYVGQITVYIHNIICMQYACIICTYIPIFMTSFITTSSPSTSKAVIWNIIAVFLLMISMSWKIFCTCPLECKIYALKIYVVNSYSI